MPKKLSSLFWRSWQCCWHRLQIATGVAAGVIDTGGKYWEQYQAAETLKWLSHEIDFKNFAKKLHNLA